MGKELNWGILSTGAIAGAFAHGLGQSRTGRLVAVGSRARAFELSALDLELTPAELAYLALDSDERPEA